MTDDRRGNLEAEPLYAGLRMTADEYERLEDDGFRYEVIDGVVVMAPSANAGHQDVIGEIEHQLRAYLAEHPVGRVLHDMDVKFDEKLLYRPDLHFISKARLPKRTPRVHVVPDMILEVLSPRTQARDLNTKRNDYERYGVTEYWIIDLRRATLTFLRLGAKGYAPVAVRGSKFASKAVPGFTLDIAAVKRVMRD